MRERLTLPGHRVSYVRNSIYYIRNYALAENASIIYVISLGDWGGWVIVVECAYASSGKVPKNDYKTTLIDPNFKDKQEYSGFK